MAITNPAQLGSGTINNSGSAHASSSHTFAPPGSADALLIVAAHGRFNADPTSNTPTISATNFSGGTIGTWTIIQAEHANTAGLATYLAVAKISGTLTGTSLGQMTISINWHGAAGSAEPVRSRIAVYSVASGFDTSSPIRNTANNNGNSGTASVGISVAGGNNLDLCFSATSVRSNTTVAADAEFFETVNDVFGGGSGLRFQEQYKNSAVDDEGGGNHTISETLGASSRWTIAAVTIAAVPNDPVVVNASVVPIGVQVQTLTYGKPAFGPLPTAFSMIFMKVPPLLINVAPQAASIDAPAALDQEPVLVAVDAEEADVDAPANVEIEPVELHVDVSEADIDAPADVPIEPVDLHITVEDVDVDAAAAELDIDVVDIQLLIQQVQASNALFVRPDPVLIALDPQALIIDAPAAVDVERVSVQVVPGTVTIDAPAGLEADVLIIHVSPETMGIVVGSTRHGPFSMQISVRERPMTITVRERQLTVAVAEALAVFDEGE